MVFEPRTEDGAYSSLRSRLVGRISGLTNFETGSFNNVWVDAFSQGMRESEIKALATQLSGWIEYSGGPITESDLDDLGIDNVTPDEINEYMEDEDLDELVRIVGISRSSGERATGTVTFTTATDTVTIPPDTEVGTQPDSDGDSLIFTPETDSTIEPSQGDTTVDVDVIAEEPGEEYNVGAGTLVYFPNPPVGVQGVTNDDATTGGIDRETNDELRERAKNAVFSTSGGGTSDGVVGYIEQNVDVADIILEEFVGQQPPYVDVIVDGGQDQDLLDAIDGAKPVGIQHNLIRPTQHTVDISIDLTGDDIETGRIEDDLTDHVNGLDISEDLYRDKIYQVVFNSDEDVVNTTSLEVFVINESHEYQTGTDVYELSKHEEMDQTTNVTEVTGALSGSSHTFVEGTDYDVIDGGSGHLDSIDWSIGGDNPDDGTDFFVDYEIANDLTMGARENINAGTMTVTVV